MSFIKSIKNAFGGSDNDDYDVYGQPTTFVNPFSKDKNVAGKEQHEDDVRITLEKHAEYAIDAEYADRAARLMNEHTQAVIDMLKGDWKEEREALMKKAEEVDKVVGEYKDKAQVAESKRHQAQTRANELTNKVNELEEELRQMENDKRGVESRLRAMEARGDGADELNKKIEELNSEIEDLKKQVADRDAEIERRDNATLPAEDGPTIEQLSQQIEQRDELIERLRANLSEMEERLNAAAEELKSAEELQKAVQEVEQFKDKKNSEISSLRQQIIDLQKRASEFDEMRKANVVLNQEKENLLKTIEQLEQTAKQNAEVQNRRSIETGNLIDGLKQQLASVSATAEDFKRKYNSLSMDGNEKAANFAKITAERDDAKAELNRVKVTLQKKQHEAQAMMDALEEKDRQIAALKQQVEQMGESKTQASKIEVPFDNDDAFVDSPAQSDDPAMGAIDDIDWADDGTMPPHPGEDPRQLSLF